MWRHRKTCFRPSNLAVGLLQLGIGTLNGFNVGTAPESSVLLLDWLWTWDHVITWHRLYTSFTAVCQLKRESVQTLLSGPPLDQCRAPSYLTELVTSVVNVPGHASLRSAERYDLVCDQDWFCPWAFSVAAQEALNSLSVDVRPITDIKLFEMKLKNIFSILLL